MESVTNGMIVLSYWLTAGMAALDWASKGRFAEWAARRSMKTAFIACMLWPMILYHLKRSDQ